MLILNWYDSLILYSMTSEFIEGHIGLQLKKKQKIFLRYIFYHELNFIFQNY